MEIEEAIAHAREVAEGCPAEDRQCAYQHDELADWLEELKAYRKTGLSPGTVSDLLGRFHRLYKIFDNLDLVDHVHFQAFLEMTERWYRAKKEGRLVVLPCRVTDTVYITETVFENGKQKWRNKPSGERVVSAKIDHVTIGGTGKPVFDLCTETGNWYYSMDPEQFYLTREAAEAALKEQEG